MSIDYTITPIFGFRVKRAELRKKYLKQIPAKYRQEPRFDPKSGLPVKPELVLEEEGAEWFEFDDAHFDDGDETEFLEYFSNKLECTYAEDGSYMCDEYDIIFGLDLKLKEKDDLPHSMTLYDMDLSYEEIADLEPKLKALADRLDKLGIKRGEARLHLALLVS